MYLLTQPQKPPAAPAPGLDPAAPTEKLPLVQRKRETLTGKWRHQDDPRGPVPLPPCIPCPRREQTQGRVLMCSLKQPLLPACRTPFPAQLLAPWGPCWQFQREPGTASLTFVLDILLLLIQPWDIPKRGAGVKDGLQDSPVVCRGHAAVSLRPVTRLQAQAGCHSPVNVYTAGPASPCLILWQPGCEAPPPGQSPPTAAQGDPQTWELRAPH